MEIVRGHACAIALRRRLRPQAWIRLRPRAEVKEASQVQADTLAVQRQDAVAFARSSGGTECPAIRRQRKHPAPIPPAPWWICGLRGRV